VLTIHLSVVLFLPLAAALVGALLPRHLTRWAVLAGTLGVLAYAVAMVADHGTGSGLRYVTDVDWISELGIRYSLGVDGMSVFLVALTAVLWFLATLAACFRVWDRPRLFFFNLALAETAVLGVFCAQDLALFVLFFDLTLVPFYFLIGAWGERNRVYATSKFVIYTLAGSLLMLAGAVALGVLTAGETGGELSFALDDLAASPLPEGTQHWIFLLFAAAFLVKMPAFPLHGWMPDAYRATPIPVLVLLSAVLSKLGAYGFLRIVLPIMPDASLHFQEVLMAIAVVSILYGSALAFSQDQARLVVGYSSVAQLGFITLGIFALDDLGAQGAVFQMVNHGIVAAALFLIIGVLARRNWDRSESLAELGGIALRAPVLAALFLVVGFATLAMPGTPNFVGEILILFGALDAKVVFGVLASVGVALAAVYMIRFYQHAMHNRVGDRVRSRDLGVRELAVVAPLVLVIVALAVYPQFVLERTEADTAAAIVPAQELVDGPEITGRDAPDQGSSPRPVTGEAVP
jgi:NADH-quinone oxidoreductase subunit M